LLRAGGVDRRTRQIRDLDRVSCDLQDLKLDGQLIIRHLTKKGTVRSGAWQEGL
jgi:hypothetical protein